MRVLALSALGKCKTLVTLALFTLEKCEDGSNPMIHLIWISTWRFSWDLDLSSLAFAYFEDSIQIHLCLLVCWLEGPINSCLLSWLVKKKFLKQRRSYHLWKFGRRAGKEFSSSTVRYKSSCTPFNNSLIYYLACLSQLIVYPSCI